MATHLLGPVNSVPVNSTYPVNGSLFVTKVLDGLGAGDRICIPFECRASVEDAPVVIEVRAENRNSVVLFEPRNSVINERDKC